MISKSMILKKMNGQHYNKILQEKFRKRKFMRKKLNKKIKAMTRDHQKRKIGMILSIPYIIKTLPQITLQWEKISQLPIRKMKIMVTVLEKWLMNKERKLLCKEKIKC